MKNEMAFFEVSPLCDFNVTESFAELSRVALKRNGMSRSWGHHKGEIYIQYMCIQALRLSNFFHAHLNLALNANCTYFLDTVKREIFCVL